MVEAGGLRVQHHPPLHSRSQTRALKALFEQQNKNLTYQPTNLNKTNKQKPLPPRQNNHPKPINQSKKKINNYLRKWSIHWFNQKILWSQTYRQAKKYILRPVFNFQQMGEQTPILEMASSWHFMTQLCFLGVEQKMTQQRGLISLAF